MPIQISNSAATTLSASVTSGATSMAVASASRFPALGSGDYFYCVLTDSLTKLEIVRVTGVSGNTLQVLRGQEGTAAQSFNTGDLVELRITRQTIVDLITQTAGTGGSGAGVQDALTPSSQTLAPSVRAVLEALAGKADVSAVGEVAQDSVAAMLASGTHSGISFTYDDAGNRLSATVTGALDAAGVKAIGLTLSDIPAKTLTELNADPTLYRQFANGDSLLVLLRCLAYWRQNLDFATGNFQNMVKLSVLGDVTWTGTPTAPIAVGDKVEQALVKLQKQISAGGGGGGGLAQATGTIGATPVVLDLAALGYANKLADLLLTLDAGVSVLVEESTDNQGSYAGIGTFTAAAGPNYPFAIFQGPGTPAPTHVRLTRSAGTSTASRYYLK